MLFMVRFDVTQPAGMSQQELWETWDREAKAALAAMEAGAVKGLWKVGGQRVVFALCDFPDPEALDRALSGLPIIVELGGAVKTEALPVYDYQLFADFLGEQVGQPG